MSLRRTLLVALLLAVTAVPGALSEPTPFLNGTVVRVTDGDTLWIQLPGEFEWLQVRFYGVDAPESEWTNVWPAQPFSAEAKKFVIDQVPGKEVSIRLKDEATYGRAVGEVFIDGKSLSRELL